MIPLIQRERNLQQISLEDELGLIPEPTTEGGLLSFLYALVDAQIIHELGNPLSRDEISSMIPFSMTEQFLRYGFPNNNTVKQLLYEYVYNEITYPIFFQNYFYDPNIPDTYDTRNVVEQSSKSYAINETNLFSNQLNNAFWFLTSISSDNKIDTNRYLSTIHENPTISRYQAIKTSLNHDNLPRNTKVPNMNFKNHIQNAVGYIENASEFESVVYANSYHSYLSENRPYRYKTWVWSGKKHTRHRGMSGVSVPVYEPYNVVNDRTGETAQLMFPRDYARDTTGANTVHCGCSELFTKSSDVNVERL